MDINWYPGHMTKARRMIEALLPSVDCVVELVDARIPLSSKNPDIEKITQNKPKLLILNKSDIADPKMNKWWQAYFEEKGYSVMLFDSRTKKAASTAMFIGKIKDIFAEKLERQKQRGIVGKSVKIMVLGIPNVGKSTFINNISGQKVAKAEDRPGVTRGKQWISLQNGIDMLDMPGILWPKLENKYAAQNLAITGAIKDNVLDIEGLAMVLLGILKVHYKNELCLRYKLPDELPEDNYELLKLVAKKRGFMISGGHVDTERAAIILIDEFRGCKIGKITLDNLDKNES
ncbi:MAG: ribosome biogenesis GTPase YlqF [Clostridiales bacterium]|nr:MAG: ribosome biogenesis GTPase YlqF [Clostridiales bacterium]